MKIKPLGFYVIVEQIKVDDVSDGGIVLPADLIAKEQEATAIGYVRAIGPTAYVGYPGCERIKATRENPGCHTIDVAELGFMQHVSAEPATPAQQWGLEIGQKVEYRKFEGKESSVKGYENHRYIPDSHIIGVIDDE